jgi:hypothetical protein
VFECTTIEPGLYYVESDNYLPLRGNGFYYHNMIFYCLENTIITLDSIEFVIKSSLTLKKILINSLTMYTIILIKTKLNYLLMV